MMGTQDKVESEGLDIPAVVNLGGFTTVYFQTESSGTTLGKSNAVTASKWGAQSTGGELSLFMGGRLSEFAGFLAEAGLGGNGTANTGGIVGAAKLAMLFPVGEARMGLVVHSSNNQGVAYSFELLNTGAANTHKMMGNSGPNDHGQHVRAFSAAQYLNTATAATGLSLVANNSSGFLVLGAYEMAGNKLVGGANNLNLTYTRLAGTVDVAGWDLGFGMQSFGGKSYVTDGNNSAGGTAINTPKATIIDAQAQGEFSGMAAGFYASYGTAAAGTATEYNPFNPAGNQNQGMTATSLNLAAELGIVPHTATLQGAVRMAKNGNGSLWNGKTRDSDNAFMVGVTFELAQNMALSFTHTTQFGSAWDAANFGNNEPMGKSANTLLLEALF
jgi:hypothetical protein